MNTVIGIAVLVVCAIGMCSIASWFFTAMRKWLAPYNNTTRLIKIGHLRTPTPYSHVPQYKGEAVLFGFPSYRDVIVPDKHNYATVVYMDHPVRQYVYDLMVTWKKLINPSRDNKYGLLAILAFLVLPFLFNKWLGVVVLFAFALLILILGPSGKRAVRCSAENAKDFSTETWREIYREVAESIDREKSGTPKHWYGDKNWAGKRW